MRTSRATSIRAQTDEQRKARSATLPTKRTVAQVLWRTDDGRVLLVDPTYRDEWLLAGGAVENGESPRAAAVREVSEELGVHVDPASLELTVVQWSAESPSLTEQVTFVFDAGIVADAREFLSGLRLRVDEVADAAFLSAGQSQLVLHPAGHARVVAGLAAAQAAQTVWLDFPG